MPGLVDFGLTTSDFNLVDFGLIQPDPGHLLAQNHPNSYPYHPKKLEYDKKPAGRFGNLKLYHTFTGLNLLSMNLMFPKICRFTNCVKITSMVIFTQLVYTDLGVTKQIFTQMGL